MHPVAVRVTGPVQPGLGERVGLGRVEAGQPGVVHPPPPEALSAHIGVDLEGLKLDRDQQGGVHRAHVSLGAGAVWWKVS